MKLLKQSRYAMRALIDLSVHAQHSYVTLNSIALRNHISAQYLEQIFAKLRKAGIVKGVKGHQGGYVLGKSPERITVAMILETVEGDYRYEKELDEDGGECGASITLQKMLIEPVNEKLEQLLNGITLADLQEDYLKNDGYEQSMYYI
ncbi:MAG: Rrf2 family transcriptional regulator [Lachnospiraceae bacterium]|nr:Rrf2 family transcriptional regulator [Lachnospiraceae bacterium]